MKSCYKQNLFHHQIITQSYVLFSIFFPLYLTFLKKRKTMLSPTNKKETNSQGITIPKGSGQIIENLQTPQVSKLELYRNQLIN